MTSTGTTSWRGSPPTPCCWATIGSTRRWRTPPGRPRTAPSRHWATSPTKAESIDPGDLTADEAVARDLLCFEAGTNADVLGLRLAEIAVNHAIGIQVDVPVVVQQLPLVEPAHAAAMVPKFTELGRWIRQSAQRLVEGVDAGRTPPRYTV